MRPRLDMHDHAIGAGIGKSLEIRVGRCDHQMHIEEFVRQRPDGAHDLWPDRDVRDEMPVHDIDMNPVGAGGDNRAHLLAEPREVGRKNGRGDQNLRPCDFRLRHL